MSALREAVLLQMRLRGFAAKTVEAYIHAMEQLWAPSGLSHRHCFFRSFLQSLLYSTGYVTLRHFVQ